MPAKTWAPPKGVSVDWEIITPAVAAEYLDQNTDNRHLRSRAVDMYTRNMLAGEWKVTGETIKFDRNGRLIDGQHRLAAIIRAEKQQPCLVVRGLEPEVQGVIDTNLHRTAGDMLRFRGVVQGDQYVMASVGRIGVARETGRLNSYGTINASISHIEIGDWLTRNPDSMEVVKKTRAIVGKKINVAPSPFAYAMWALYRIDAEAADSFLEAITEFKTEGENDPRTTLIRAFSLSTYSHRPGITIGLMFTTWNAWRSGQILRSLPLVDAKGKQLVIPEPI
jgi:hypothetical protein